MFPGCYGDEKRSGPMQIAAERRVQNFTDGSIETSTKIYLVQTGETVEELMRRVGMDGTSDWHYSEAEVRLKLVAQPKG